MLRRVMDDTTFRALERDAGKPARVTAPRLRRSPGGDVARAVTISANCIWRLPGLVSGVESVGLHSISADSHVAPAAGMVLAGVEKQPSAAFAGARMDMVH